MEVIFLMLACLGGLRETEALSVTGVLGGTVTIKCSHTNAFSNVKYFCKGACEDEDVLISSSEKKKDSDEKYGISDEGNIFYVTISHLTTDDSGTYWCGIDRFGFNTHNGVILTVIEGNRKHVTEVSQSIVNGAIDTEASSSNKLVYIGAGLGMLVLALAIVLLVFFRHRSRDTSRSCGKVHNTVCATPVCQREDARHITTPSIKANVDQERDTNSIFSSSSIHQQDTMRENIYSNVTKIQPDSLCYSTVSFNKHTNHSAVTPRTEAVTYSTISYISIEESAF